MSQSSSLWARDLEISGSGTVSPRCSADVVGAIDCWQDVRCALVRCSGGRLRCVFRQLQPRHGLRGCSVLRPCSSAAAGEKQAKSGSTHDSASSSSLVLPHYARERYEPGRMGGVNNPKGRGDFAVPEAVEPSLPRWERGRARRGSSVRLRDTYIHTHARTQTASEARSWSGRHRGSPGGKRATESTPPWR